MTNDSLAETVSKLLREVPDHWAAVSLEESTEEGILAIRKLTEAGFIEQRVTVRIQIPGIDPAYRITFEATGEFWGEYALRAVRQDWWSRWGKHLEVLAQELGKPVELIVIPERIQWRITDQGRLARADLEEGEQCPIDFALKRGFFDGQPRLLPDGRTTFRQPVPGHGHLVSIENVQDKPLAVDVAKFSAASELAQAFAKEFAPVIKAARAETRAAGTGDGSEGQPPPETGKPAGEFVFLREGRTWFIRAFGKEGHLLGLKGMHYLATLVAKPGRPVPMTELVAAAKGQSPDSKLHGAMATHSPQPVTDVSGQADMERRLRELKDAICDAEKHGDTTQAELYRNEFNALSEHVQHSRRRDGKARTFATLRDKMRSSIAKALKRVYDALRRAGMSELAHHLEVSISAQGDSYIYSASPEIPWVLE